MIRRVFRYTWIVLILAGIYLGWTYYSQWILNKEIRQQLEESQKSQDRSISDHYSSDLSILNFYVIPQAVHKGETAELCYGVSNAESIRIEPPIDNIWPAYSRCVEIAPANSTIFKLTASDAEGNTVTSETFVNVIQD